MTFSSSSNSSSEDTRGYRIGSMMSDSMSDTLFNQEPPISRHIIERKLRLQVRAFWHELKLRLDSGELSQAGVEKRLAELDTWIAGKLSGQNELALARDAEENYPEWIRCMPQTLALRYEELRVARLWSALLNPEALTRLQAAIAMERRIEEMGGDL